MRARNLKPSLFKNEELGTADPLYTLLYEGLWCMADREGRLEDRPIKIRGEVFPHRQGLDADAMLGWLQAHGFIRRYQIGHGRYIEIIKFKKHQSPHHTEKPSEIPPYNDRALTVKSRKRLRENPPDSLTPDSLTPDSGFLTPELAAAPPVASETLVTPSDISISETAPDTTDAKVARPRNELFDTVAEVTASDPKASGAHIGRVCKSLKAAEPPYTPEEVRRWAEQLREEGWMQGYPSLAYLEKNIGRVRAKPAPATGGKHVATRPMRTRECTPLVGDGPGEGAPPWQDAG